MSLIVDFPGCLLNYAQRAWLAGLLEGEGCFDLRKTPTKAYPRIQLHMTDHDVIERAAGLMRTNVNGPYSRGANHKLVYTANVTRTDQALTVMAQVYPWMSERRQAKIDEIHAVLGREMLDV